MKPGSGISPAARSLVAAALVLACLGWVGIGRYETLTAGTGRLLRQQLAWSVVAAAAAVAVAMLNQGVISRWSYPLFAATILLLILVFLTQPVHGAKRWFRFGPLGFQPSEFAKITSTLALARFFAEPGRCQSLRGVGLGILLMAVPAALILREPDLGSAMLLAPVFFVMLAVAGARWGVIVRLGLVGMAALPLLCLGMTREQASRITSLLAQPGPSDVVPADAYQLHQAKQMLALGGVWGSALTGATIDNPDVYHLPEARGDFIFCVLGERLGLIGLGLILGLYAVLVRGGFAVAAAAREPFGRLAAAGLTTLLAAQVLLNTGMTVGLLPVTGVPLPLVSYGGSGMAAYGLVIGVLVNISRHPKPESAS
jgi:rod shape determining protein RodA